jgi:hypothetical protein
LGFRTHTIRGREEKGRREGTRTASRNHQGGNKRKNNKCKPAGKTKEGKAGMGGGESTQEPNPGTQKSKQRKAEQATEAGQQREWTNTLLWVRQKRRKEKEREGEGRGCYAFSIHEPTGAREQRCSQLYASIIKYPGLTQRRGRGVVPSCPLLLIWFSF